MINKNITRISEKQLSNTVKVKIKKLDTRKRAVDLNRILNLVKRIIDLHVNN